MLKLLPCSLLLVLGFSRALAAHDVVIYGDTLAGIIGALLSQGVPAEPALVLAAHLHGAAADELAQAGDGPVGITASETASQARRVWNRWIYGAR